MVNGIPSRKMQCSNHYKEKKSAYLDLIEAFLHLGLMKLSSMQLCSAKSLTFDVIPSGMSFI
jgi:hypothetical protein